MTAQGVPATPAKPRASAARVAKWLVGKGRSQDAVDVLTAWAVTGPNDEEGQTLLAEALRIDPSAAVAKAAFERMEGIVGDHGAALDAAIAKYPYEELTKIESEIKKPSFRRAQVGFNNNMKFRDQVFHIQTEDSGLDKPHLITHLFADGGRVIKSHKRIYASEVSRPDVSAYVRALMKAQHMEMVLMLRDGKFDDILAGKRIGGMDTLTEPPNADVRKLTKGKRDSTDLAGPAEQIRRAQFKVAEAAPASPHEPTPPPSSAKASEKARAVPASAPRSSKPTPTEPTEHARAHAKFHVLRALWGAPDAFSPTGDEFVIGRTGAGVALEGERFCRDREATIRWTDGKLWLEDMDGGSGVFLRIKTPVELELGDEFVVGDQLVRILENPLPDVGPGPGPTYFYSSPTWLSSFRVVQIYEGEREGACVVARGTTVIVGRSVADLVFASDPLVAEQHCIVEEQAGTIVLTDLGSRTGVFVRMKGEHELSHGDEILIGRTRLLVDLLKG